MDSGAENLHVFERRGNIVPSVREIKRRGLSEVATSDSSGWLRSIVIAVDWWRPGHSMAHILPHWTWPDRVGQVTPVHVFTSGVEAELFLNGKSLGRKQRGQYEYRLRWDDVIYEQGELKVVAYKNSKVWATDSMKTADAPA